MLEHLPDASSLAIAAWSIPDVLPVLGELRAGDPLMGAGLPSLSDRVGFVFDLTARRAQQLPTGSLDIDVLQRSRVSALELADGELLSLVHGDLHPGNVLATGGARGAVAIDPRPAWETRPTT